MLIFFSVASINIFSSEHHRKKYSIICCRSTASSRNTTENHLSTVPAFPSKTWTNFQSYRLRLAGVFSSAHPLLLLKSLTTVRTVVHASVLLSSLPILATFFPSAACFPFYQLCQFLKGEVDMWRYKIMWFVRLLVIIWRRQCVCNIFLRRSHRMKLTIDYPLSCSRAVFTDPQIPYLGYSSLYLYLGIPLSYISFGNIPYQASLQSPAGCAERHTQAVGGGPQ